MESLKTNKIFNILFYRPTRLSLLFALLPVFFCVISPLSVSAQQYSIEEVFSSLDNSTFTKEEFSERFIEIVLEDPTKITPAIYSNLTKADLLPSIESYLKAKINSEVGGITLESLNHYKKLGKALFLPTSKFNQNIDSLIKIEEVILKLSEEEGEISKLQILNNEFIAINNYFEKPVFQLRNRFDSGLIANNWNFWTTLLFSINKEFGAPANCYLDFSKSNFKYKKLSNEEVGWISKFLNSLPSDLKSCLSSSDAQFLNAGKKLVQEKRGEELAIIINILDSDPKNYSSSLELKSKLVQYSIDDPSLIEISNPFITKEVLGTLDISSRISLFFQGRLFFWIYLVSSLFVILLVSLAGLLFYFIGPDLDIGSYMESVTEKVSFKKKTNRGYAKIVESDDEYSSLLSLFELDDNATDADIKKAYRALVKQYHPDTSDTDEREKFEKIHKAYERLLDLRKGWFGKSS